MKKKVNPLAYVLFDGPGVLPDESSFDTFFGRKV